jgi:endonuclease/exonuclease/phosphatase family metal-dependent hydrolase
MIYKSSELRLASYPTRLRRLFDWSRTWVPGPLQAHLRSMARPITAVTSPTNSVRWQPNTAMPTPTPSNKLTVLTTNLWHDWPRFRQVEERLEALACLVEAKGVDVLLLQEVSRTADFQTDEWLAQRLNMAFIYARANGHAGGIGFEEGLAIFSRYPMSQPKLQPLDLAGSFIVQRLALGVTIQTPMADLPVFSTHLSIRRWRNVAQLQQLQQWVQAMTPGLPALIGGDFNAGENTPRMTAVRQNWIDSFRWLHPEKDGATHSLNWPWGKTFRRQRLDYLFLKPGPSPWQIREANHAETQEIPHSDHQVVLARLTYG